MEPFSSDPDLTPTGRKPRAAVNRAIRELMAKQAGTVGYDQLTTAGLRPKSIVTRLDSGELYLRTGDWPPKNSQSTKGSRRSALPSRGVFTAHPGPLNLDALRWRAVLAAPGGGHLSDVSACALHNLIRQPSKTMHVLHLGGDWRSPTGIIGRHTTHLPSTDRTKVKGLPTSTISRAVLDAARRVDAELLDDLLDRAVELRVYNELDFRRVMKERPSIPGVEALEDAIARLDEKSGEFRSTFERKTTRLVQTSTRIPAPVVNVLVEGFRPDLHWWKTRAIVECDGADYHRSLDQVLADEQREEILSRLGYVILRLRWSQVRYEQERTLKRIERFVLANRDAPVPRR